MLAAATTTTAITSPSTSAAMPRLRPRLFLQLTRRTLLEIAGPQPQDRPQPLDTLPFAYQDILAVFARTDGGLRAKDLCHALDLGNQPRHIEAVRAKLKRLVG